MSYRVRLHPNVARFLRKSPSHVHRINKKLQDIREDPFRYLEHYEREDVYKLRIGDYRALIDVDTGILKLADVDIAGFRNTCRFTGALCRRRRGRVSCGP
jgi:mRNA-degrading endonuclease RelE of RelBE toxin-antitoxin system